MRTYLAGVAVTCCALICPRFATAQMTPGKWRDDLRFLAEQLPQKHPNLFHQLPADEFESSVRELHEAIPRLAEHEIVIAMMEIVAAVGDGHTRVAADYGEPHLLPFRFSIFSDGVFVTQVTREHTDLYGAQRVRIGKYSIAEVTAELAKRIAHDNAAGLKSQLPNFLVTGQFLHAIGAWERIDRGSIELKRGDQRITVNCETSSLTEQRQTKWKGLEGDAPLYLRKANLDFWNDWLPESQTLYFKYNRCRAPIGFLSLVNGTRGFMRENPPERFVLDLRHNGGGSSVIFAPLLLLLKSDARLNTKGRLYVIIGRRTFSSAVLNALEMRQTNAIFVGEPTGGRPNHYGEVRSFQLPNSKTRVYHSTKHFTRIKDANPPSLEPDLHVELSSSDWFEGRDPVLAKIHEQPVDRGDDER